MSQLIENAKKEFARMIKEYGSDPYYLSGHVPEVAKWVRQILKNHPEANEEIAVLGAWLHDLGHYPIPEKIDHAIRSEERARAFLENNHYPKDKMDKVLHCVRAHRCRDVMPDSIEAKIVACADSASHMTDYMYLDIAKDDKKDKCDFRVYAKMERDYEDLSNFPEIQNGLKDLYEAWKNLIKEYEKVDID